MIDRHCCIIKWVSMTKWSLKKFSTHEIKKRRRKKRKKDDDGNQVTVVEETKRGKSKQIKREDKCKSAVTREKRIKGRGRRRNVQEEQSSSRFRGRNIRWIEKEKEEDEGEKKLPDKSNAISAIINENVHSVSHDEHRNESTGRLKHVTGEEEEEGEENVKKEAKLLLTKGSNIDCCCCCCSRCCCYCCTRTSCRVEDDCCRKKRKSRTSDLLDSLSTGYTCSQKISFPSSRSISIGTIHISQCITTRSDKRPTPRVSSSNIKSKKYVLSSRRHFIHDTSKLKYWSILLLINLCTCFIVSASNVSQRYSRSLSTLQQSSLQPQQEQQQHKFTIDPENDSKQSLLSTAKSFNTESFLIKSIIDGDIHSQQSQQQQSQISMQHLSHHHHHYIHSNSPSSRASHDQLHHLPSPAALLLPATSSSVASNLKHNSSVINVLIGTTARVPCDLSPPSEGGIVQLILWYKSSNGTGPPIYTVDARNSSRSLQSSSSSSFTLTLPSATSSSNLNAPNQLLKGIHFIPDAYKDRLHFNISLNSPSILTIASVRDDDSSEYSCRVSDKYYNWIWLIDLFFFSNINCIYTLLVYDQVNLMRSS